MIQNEELIFAIYKSGNHLGNEKARSKESAIHKYLVAASFKNSMHDKEFTSLYTAKTVEKGIHYL